MSPLGVPAPLAGVDPLMVLVRALVALGPLVVVPLGLAVSTAPSDAPRIAGLQQRIARLAVPAAVAFAAALALPAGTLAASLTAPWVAACALVALVGVARFLGRPAASRFALAELATDAGFGYLAVGGAWAFASRADLAVMGFAGTQALLTAAHFHYAGFGACVLAGALGRARAAQGSAHDAWDRAALLLTTSAVAILALGIATARSLEVAAAFVLVVGVTLTARLGLRVAARDRGAARALGRVSAASGIVAAGFAAHYATVGFGALDAASLRRMALFHASVNALGFVVAGLVARLLGDRARA